jgi:hypothetical protein
MKNQRKIDIKARGFHINIDERGTPMNNEKGENAKRGGEKLRS